MSTVSVSHDSSATPDEVWAVVTDMDRWVEVISAIESVERLDGRSTFGVETAWRETRTMFGREATEDMEISEYEEGTRYATTAESHGSKYFSELRVDASGPGSRLTMTFSGEPQTTFTKIMDVTVGKLFMGSTRKAFAADLADIARAAERPS